MKLLLLSVAVFVGFVCSLTIPGKHAVAVKGTLLCGKKPAENVRVRLFRVKQEKTDDLNQIIDESLTGPSGMFQVQGNTNGFALNQTNMVPVVTFYHSCDEDPAKVAKNGYRKFSYNVPEDYVVQGARAKKTYDIGTLNIQVEFPNEKHDKKFVDRKATAAPARL